MSAMEEKQPNVTPASAAKDYVESVVRRSGTSFFWAMRRLPEVKRQGMYAVYAYCREVDDIADDEGEQAGKTARLGQWRGEIEHLYGGGEPEFLVAQALVNPIVRFGLQKKDFLALIDGMETDAADRLRIAAMDGLFLYCDQVACAVGRLSNRIFGVDEERGDRVAHALGLALQLTNILSDLREDAGRNRLYLPADLLTAHGINEDNPEAVLAHPAIAGVCAELAEIATNRFAEAESALALCDRRQMRPAIMMMQVYRRILEKLKKRGWERISGPVRLPRLQKLWIAFRYGIF
ncbi:MAG: squalene synthase HpnD [Rhodospirillales bacterium RIFCSPLOWO2_12_FULL_58_28]|nr:MAG: squalene synthase HpnD [Rhodospirillales bacterium RIFCSPLOWO2_02_FULL_58_16]OHC79186.1 MAG: squalene synthase HpnD [Rhodospirillales bacterium RIFCSPLOWO2_12_FULL_58_28]